MGRSLRRPSRFRSASPSALGWDTVNEKATPETLEFVRESGVKWNFPIVSHGKARNSFVFLQGTRLSPYKAMPSGARFNVGWVLIAFDFDTFISCK